MTEDAARNDRKTSTVPVSRRGVMAALGAAGFGAVLGGPASAQGGGSGGGGDGNQPWYSWDADVDAGGNDLTNLNAVDVDHLYTPARAADVVVWRDDEGVFHADGTDERVASGEEFMGVVQAAVDSLSEDRTTKERVLVASSGEVSADDETTGVEIPSYTVVDVAGEITVDGQVDAILSATDAEYVDVPRLTVKGEASQAVFLSGCSKVRLGKLWIEDVTVQGVRIQDGSEDIWIGTAYIANNGHHGIETYTVDRIQIGQVIGVDPGSSVVLLNETTDATVGQVVGRNPKFDYATFRLANGCRNVTAGQIVSRGGVRGVSIITGTRHVTVGEVNVAGGEKAGMLLVDVRNVNVLGGVIRNTNGSGVNIWSIGLQGTTSEINEGINLTNLRIVDDRPEGERQQEWAINERGANLHNRFVDNDLRGGGTEGLINVGSETTFVNENVGGGIDSGTVELACGDGPAARVEGVTDHRMSSLALRAQPIEAPDCAFAWKHYFEWTGDQWDLVFEWRTDPGKSLTLEYIVDRPQATTDREFDREQVWEESVPTVEDGTYRIEAVHSGMAMEVADGSESTGANVQQGEWADEPHQRWRVEGAEPTETGWRSPVESIVAEHSDMALTVNADGNAVQGNGGQSFQSFTLERYEGAFQIQTDDGRLQVEDASTDAGAHVVEGPWEGRSNQLWRFVPLDTEE